MIARTALLALLGLVAVVPPAFADGTAPARPLRPLRDSGVPDSLLPPLPQPVLTASGDDTTGASNYEARESQAANLEQFRGGEGVSLYIGGGVLTAVLIVALVVILL
ncbi:MAG: hypothetical protein ABUR63_02890 [Verrucomicrobiota bacterium]